jgi:uncharacterized membrane protein
VPLSVEQRTANDDSLPRVHRVGFGRPLHWLGAAWRDLVASPIASLAYGLLFAIAGDFILLQVFAQPHLFLLAVSAFFLVAPWLAAGLYEISRRHEFGHSATFVASLDGWRRNARPTALLGLLLALVAVIWGRISGILFGVVYGADVPPNLNTVDFVTTVLFSGLHHGFVIAWLLAGATLALLVFGAAAFAMPMLLDRPREAGGTVPVAILTSLRAVSLNLGTMLVWGTLIVALTLLGFATFLFGLVVLMPLLGHASWHAYRELVEPLR